LLEFRRIGRTLFTVDWLVDKGSASAGNRRPLLKEALDLSQRHALGVFGDNFLIKSTKASLPFWGINCGSNSPARSRGPSISSLPSSLNKVLVPFRQFLCFLSFGCGAYLAVWNSVKMIF
jgi:hypothetical protein